jgi:hypothetical protein
MFRKSILTVLFSTLLLACGGGPDIDSKLDAIENEQSAQVQIFCDCYVELGIPSREMCVAFFPTPTPQERACAFDAFELDADASVDYLDCVFQAQADYTTCMETDLVCTDDTSLNACDNVYGAARNACPQLPANVDAALNACAPQQ